MGHPVYIVEENQHSGSLSGRLAKESVLLLKGLVVAGRQALGIKASTSR